MHTTDNQQADLAAILSREPLAREGPVLDYVGAGARRLSSRNDLNVASWLVDNHTRLEEIFRRVKEDPMVDRRRLVQEHAGDLSSAGVSLEDVIDFVSWGDTVQIRNDLKAILEGNAPPTETEQFMVAEGRVDPQSDVLDIGCSCGKHMRNLLPLAPRRLVGADFNLFALALGAEAWKRTGNDGRMSWMCADALDLPFRDCSFTHVNSFGTLILLPARRALAEYRRVLAPGGRLTITVEGMGNWRRFWDQAKGHPVRRLHLTRGLVGDWLLGLGFDWQSNQVLRKLAKHVQFHEATILKLVNRSGFAVERSTVLRDYKGKPWIIGISAIRV